MAVHLFCRCGAVYDPATLDTDALYKCRECGSILSPADAVDTEEHAQRQSSVIPKSGTFISLVLIVALALLGVAVGSMKVSAKVDDAKKEIETRVDSIRPEIENWKKRAADIRIVDTSKERSSEYMAGVFERVTTARKKVYPAVVRIFCSTQDGSGGTGSGAIFMPTGYEERGTLGYIVTNYHVVADAYLLEVTLSNQETAICDLIYADDFCDVAVIKLKDPSKAQDITPARFGDSDKVQIGDYCMSMGAPQGLGRSAAFGIIVGKGRYIPTPLGSHISHREHQFFQMDAAINHGNSGGPLVSLRGEIIGLNTLGITQLQKVGFAVASNYEQEIAEEIVRNHETSRVPLVNRSHYGLHFLPLSAWGLEGTGGVIVASVENDSPAYNAGIRPGDVITSAKNTKTGTAHELNINYHADLSKANYAFNKIDLGTTMEVSWRNPITGEQKSGQMISIGHPARVDPFEISSRIYFNAIFASAHTAAFEVAGFQNEDSGGFQIVSWADPLDFLPGGPGLDLSQVGLQRGDIIRSINGQPANFARQMFSVIMQHINRNAASGRNDPMIWEIVRGGNKLYLALNIN